MKFRYPNESEEYRQARDELAVDEAALIKQVKAVAANRRTLPRGGRLKENYTFSWATDARLGESLSFTDLFEDKDTLLIYSFMYGPDWDNPCPSCTSLVDGFDRVTEQVAVDASFFVVGKAPASMINDWARLRGWNQANLISGYECSYQADYGCERESDQKQIPKMNVFQREGDEIYHFWGTEIEFNDIDMVWAYWNLMDLTPAGRPDRPNPPQNFRSRFLEDNYG